MTLVGTGLMLSRCLEAAEALAGEGIEARVIEVHTIKPFDTETIVTAARETGALVTAEEHSIIGGLGGAVIEALAGTRPCPWSASASPTASPPRALRRTAGPPGAGVSDIVAAARRVVGLKQLVVRSSGTGGHVAGPRGAVGIADRFGTTGPYDELLALLGLAVSDIVAAARRAVGGKRG